ncbi:hypothetical protein, partial [Alicycliphilus denitrificans]|uniref:hypothetical protein n=1 Tax=Alicycliphilus denitrificans TaxID=179636 RepID=UPI001CA51DD6
SLETCSIVSTILQSWARCPLLTARSIWGHRTDTKDPHAATVAYLAKIKGVSEKTIERALKKPQR